MGASGASAAARSSVKLDPHTKGSMANNVQSKCLCCGEIFTVDARNKTEVLHEAVLPRGWRGGVRRTCAVSVNSNLLPVVHRCCASVPQDPTGAV
jgi:hypothetical protein